MQLVNNCCCERDCYSGIYEIKRNYIFQCHEEYLLHTEVLQCMRSVFSVALCKDFACALHIAILFTDWSI